MQKYNWQTLVSKIENRSRSVEVVQNGVFIDSNIVKAYPNTPLGTHRLDNQDYIVVDDNTIRDAIDNYDPSTLVTTFVTNMHELFKDSSFNGNIENWDVRNVRNMCSMFHNNFAFNKDIGNWDTGNVMNMREMFNNALSFTNAGSSSIRNWNTMNVTNLSGMFGSTPFNQDIGNWNVSNCTNFNHMFSNATSFNQDLSNWTINNSATSTSFDNNTSSWVLPKPVF